MNQGKYIFSQVFSLISHKVFTTVVNRYNGDYKTRQFSCWKQFLCMAFGQLTQRDSLSDAILCLTANSNKLYHLGIGEVISKTTLTRANENRDWRIYADFCMVLIEEARCLYINDSELDFDLANNVFAIDATTIDMCLSAFFWAKFRSTKGGIKIHTQLDLKTSIPSFVHITPANVHELNVLDMIRFEPDSFYVLDRGYIDFDRFYHIHSVGAYFITRARKDFSFALIKSLKTKEQNIICDQMIKPRKKNFYAFRDYPEAFRRIKYYDAETARYFVFITNNTELNAGQIATLYRHRWKIELFFKWIKQHLKIQSFWGRSENAVKTQIWIAISVYALVAIVKKKFGLKQSLYEILQVLSICIFEKISINELFENKLRQHDFKELKNNQLDIFNL
jgi:hypothetical protein